MKRCSTPPTILCVSVLAALSLTLHAQQRISIDAHAPATPFPHFWETMFGSGRADEDHGNVLKSYKAMGSPQYPRPNQVEQMNRESALPPPERTTLHEGKLTLKLGQYTLALVHVGEKP